MTRTIICPRCAPGPIRDGVTYVMCDDHAKAGARGPLPPGVPATNVGMDVGETLAHQHHTVVSRRGPSKPRSKPTGEHALRLILSAPGLDVDDVVAYVREALASHKGQYETDNLWRGIEVVRVLKRAWVEVVETDATSGEDNEP